MELINHIFGVPLGYIMKFCYDLIGNYGLAIILFTAITKVLLLPVSILVQKNSIKMIKIKPQLDAIKCQYGDDKDLLLDKESELYKQEKYNPFAGTIPLMIQLPLILGLLQVIYKPLEHILHIPENVITKLSNEMMKITNLANLGPSPQLQILQNSASLQDSSEYINLIQSMQLTFLGINLSVVPSIANGYNTLFIPMMAGISALIMCIIQNKINVLQIEQGKMAQWGMTLFMVLFSLYFSFIVPAGIGLYWTFGNLFSIGIMFLVNKIESPSKYIDYETMNRIKERVSLEQQTKKENHMISKQYYKELKHNGIMQKMELLFYAEQGGFYKYFQNIIEQLLLKSNIVIYYVTSDSNDPILHQNNPRIKAFYLCDTHLIPFFMKLECQIVVTTTPDLERYHLKRSKIRKNIEYIYIDHACATLNMTYRTGAFDYYDTIFVTSKQQGIEIREIEKLRHTRKKRIVKYGYGLIDNMIASYEDKKMHVNEKPTIVIAPSWQYDNLLDSCIDDILKGLLGKGFKIVLRPHPQYIKRFPTPMESIISRYQQYCGDDFIIELDFSSSETVYMADLLITDWSSVAFEYSFTTNRPTLFINTELKVINKDYDKIGIVPFNITGREKIGHSIEKHEVEQIASICQSMLQSKDKYAKDIQELKTSYFYNLGTSGEAGADYLIERLQPHVSQTESENN